MNPESDTGGARPPAPPEVVKPSLLASLDVIVKVLVTVGSFLLPLVVLAFIEGEPIVGSSLFVGVEALSLWPAIIAAFLPAVQLAFTEYRFEEDGLVVKVQILSKSERRVSWEKVTALRHRRSAIDAILGIERLDVVAYGERGATLHLVGLRKAAPWRDRIARRMRDTASVDALFRGD